MEKTNNVGFSAKFACFLIGWNPNLLRECGETSRRSLRKYVSAITILSIIWGTIGYCFAERYIGIEIFFGRILTSLIFIVVIVCIERYIILTGKLGWLAGVRFTIALLMAVLGSTIFDQIIFKDDVEFKMNEIRTIQINEEVPRRNKQIDAELATLNKEIDSINNANIRLRQEIALNPVSKFQTYSSKKKHIGENPDGTPKFVTEVTSENHVIENPLIAQTIANDSIVSRYEKRRVELQNKKLETEQIVRKEYESARIGFLQELEALIAILSENTIALIFYIFLLFFLTSLELLVLITKSGDKESDYDLVVQHQQKIKEETLKRMEQNILSATEHYKSFDKQ